MSLGDLEQPGKIAACSLSSPSKWGAEREKEAANRCKSRRVATAAASKSISVGDILALRSAFQIARTIYAKKSGCARAQAHGRPTFIVAQRPLYWSRALSPASECGEARQKAARPLRQLAWRLQWGPCARELLRSRPTGREDPQTEGPTESLNIEHSQRVRVRARVRMGARARARLTSTLEPDEGQLCCAARALAPYHVGARTRCTRLRKLRLESAL